MPLPLPAHTSFCSTSYPARARHRPCGSRASPAHNGHAAAGVTIDARTARRRNDHFQEQVSCRAATDGESGAALDAVCFTFIVDDIVFPDGRTLMGVLGGGGEYMATFPAPMSRSTMRSARPLTHMPYRRAPVVVWPATAPVVAERGGSDVPVTSRLPCEAN